jgi:hypothetical protein
MRPGTVHFLVISSLFLVLLVRTSFAADNPSPGGNTNSTQAVKPRPRPRRKANPAKKAPNPPPIKKEAADENDRVVGGHRFLRNDVIDFPFTSPYINSTLQGAMATITVPGATQNIKSVGLSPLRNRAV